MVFLKQAEMPNGLWSLAYLEANVSYNHDVHSALNISPYESFFKKPPNYTHRRRFGSMAYFMKPQTQKLEDKCRYGVLVRNPLHGRCQGYTLLTLDTVQSVTVDDVQCNEVLNGAYTPGGKAQLPEALLKQQCGHTGVSAQPTQTTAFLDDVQNDNSGEWSEDEIDEYFHSCHYVRRQGEEWFDRTIKIGYGRRAEVITQR